MGHLNMASPSEFSIVLINNLSSSVMYFTKQRRISKYTLISSKLPLNVNK